MLFAYLRISRYIPSLCADIFKIWHLVMILENNMYGGLRLKVSIFILYCATKIQLYLKAFYDIGMELVLRISLINQANMITCPSRTCQVNYEERHIKETWAFYRNEYRSYMCCLRRSRWFLRNYLITIILQERKIMYCLFVIFNVEIELWGTIKLNRHFYTLIHKDYYDIISLMDTAYGFK